MDGSNYQGSAPEGEKFRININRKVGEMIRGGRGVIIGVNSRNGTKVNVINNDGS